MIPPRRAARGAGAGAVPAPRHPRDPGVARHRDGQGGVPAARGD